MTSRTYDTFNTPDSGDSCRADRQPRPVAVAVAVAVAMSASLPAGSASVHHAGACLSNPRRPPAPALPQPSPPPARVAPRQRRGSLPRRLVMARPTARARTGDRSVAGRPGPCPGARGGVPFDRGSIAAPSLSMPGISLMTPTNRTLEARLSVLSNAQAPSLSTRQSLRSSLEWNSSGVTGRFGSVTDASAKGQSPSRYCRLRASDCASSLRASSTWEYLSASFVESPAENALNMSPSSSATSNRA